MVTKNIDDYYKEGLQGKYHECIICHKKYYQITDEIIVPKKRKDNTLDDVFCACKSCINTSFPKAFQYAKDVYDDDFIILADICCDDEQRNIEYPIKDYDGFYKIEPDDLVVPNYYAQRNIYPGEEIIDSNMFTGMSIIKNTADKNLVRYYLMVEGDNGLKIDFRWIKKIVIKWSLDDKPEIKYNREYYEKRKTKKAFLKPSIFITLRRDKYNKKVPGELTFEVKGFRNDYSYKLIKGEVFPLDSKTEDFILKKSIALLDSVQFLNNRDFEIMEYTRLPELRKKKAEIIKYNKEQYKYFYEYKKKRELGYIKSMPAHVFIMGHYTGYYTEEAVKKREEHERKKVILDRLFEQDRQEALRKKAEEERKKAEDAERQRQEEEKRKAEEERRKKAEDARRKAESYQPDKYHSCLSRLYMENKPFTEKELRTQRNKLVKVLHPDGATVNTNKEIKLVNEAYDYLKKFARKE